MSLCHKLWFSNSYNFATWWCRPLIFQTNNAVRWYNQSLKYKRFTASVCKDIRYGKFEFVAKTQLLKHDEERPPITKFGALCPNII